jgi:hypothetical protein
MPISFIRLVIFLSFRIDGKKHDNADGPSGSYAAAGSVAATAGNLPTKLMSNLAQPPLCTHLKAIFAPLSTLAD